MDSKKKYQYECYASDLEERGLQDLHNKKNRIKSKKVMKVFGCITFVVIALIVGFIVRYESKRPSLEKMMLYMEEKYGEEFEVLAVNTQTWMDDYTDIEVRSAKFPDEYITVRTYLEDGKRIYEDSYIEILKRDEFNATFQKVVSEVYGECKVYVTSVEAMTTLPAEVDMNTNINDILSNKNVRAIISIYTEDDIVNKDIQIEQLRKELQTKKWYTLVNIYYLKEGILKNINEKNRGEILKGEKQYISFGRLILTREFKVSSLEWE